MSYDFEIRSDAQYSKHIKYTELINALLEFEQIIQTSDFTYEYNSKTVFGEIYLELIDQERDSIDLFSVHTPKMKMLINCIRMIIPFGDYSKEGIAEISTCGKKISAAFGLRLYDLQRSEYL
ncbi:MAG: hypothetical protein HGB35_09255 [Geobacteraceae bacterium]|nr:hypothetical protein [Geobacteraceae bacterium]